MTHGALRVAVVRGSLAVVAASVLGCAKRPPPAPAPAAHPPDIPEGAVREPVRAPGPLVVSNAGEEASGDLLAILAIDPILTSPEGRNGRIEERIDWWLNVWQTRLRDAFKRGLSRIGGYEDFVRAELASRDLPPSLLYLPLIEANYYPTAVSPAGAAGLWQFMPRTARWLGLQVNSLIDERFDAFAATPVALDYLLALNTQFESWFLTLAAYNAGPGRVEQVIRRHGRGRPRDDALYLRIRSRLPAETRDFIPKYLAAVRMASLPERYGIVDHLKAPSMRFDSVTIDGAASIDVIARVADVTEEEVKDLNPQILAEMTPGASSTVVRLPEGSAQGFPERFANIPLRDRVNRHVVSAGETFSLIAQDYRISVDELRSANPGVAPRRLQIGSILVVPGVLRDSPAPEAVGASTAADHPSPADSSGVMSAVRTTDAPRPGDTVHVVARGESLWLIARLYGVDLELLRAHNRIGQDILVQPGDSIRIPPSR